MRTIKVSWPGADWNYYVTPFWWWRCPRLWVSHNSQHHAWYIDLWWLSIYVEQG